MRITLNQDQLERAVKEFVKKRLSSLKEAHGKNNIKLVELGLQVVDEANITFGRWDKERSLSVEILLPIHNASRGKSKNVKKRRK